MEFKIFYVPHNSKLKSPSDEVLKFMDCFPWATPSTSWLWLTSKLIPIRVVFCWMNNFSSYTLLFLCVSCASFPTSTQKKEMKVTRKKWTTQTPFHIFFILPRLWWRNSLRELRCNWKEISICMEESGNSEERKKGFFRSCHTKWSFSDFINIFHTIWSALMSIISRLWAPLFKLNLRARQSPTPSRRRQLRHVSK